MAPGSVALEVRSSSLTARKVLKVDAHGLTLTTYVWYEGTRGRVLWSAIAPVHHLIEPLLVTSAVSRRRSTPEHERPSRAPVKGRLRSLRQVQLHDGTIEYDDTGGSGQVVVLCHGLLMDHSVWDLVLPHLDEGLRVIRPVLPVGAHRLPMRPDADLSLRGQAARLGEVLDLLEVDSVVLVVSDTGFPLLLAAEGHPRVGALVVLPCEAFDNIPPGLPGKTVALAARVPGGVLAAAAALRLPFAARLPFTLGPMSRRPIDRRLVSRWTAPVLHDRAVRRDLVKYATAADFSAIGTACQGLSGFDGASVLLWSRTDRLMPFVHAVALSQTLPQATLVAFDDGGSLLQLDEPVRVAAEINALARA